MTIVERHKRELVRAARFAVRRFKNVRKAAAYIGMSRSSFHDLCAAHRIKFPRAAGSRKGRAYV